MNVAIFWDIAPLSPYMDQCFVRKYHLLLQLRKTVKQETSVQQLIFDPEDGGDTSETPVHIQATRL
jgi:hypothetical protein